MKRKYFFGYLATVVLIFSVAGIVSFFTAYNAPAANSPYSTTPTLVQNQDNTITAMRSWTLTVTDGAAAQTLTGTAIAANYSTMIEPFYNVAGSTYNTAVVYCGTSTLTAAGGGPQILPSGSYKVFPMAADKLAVVSSTTAAGTAQKVIVTALIR